MDNLTFRHRVAVESPTGAILHYLSPERAREMLIANRCEIFARHESGAVSIIRVLAHQHKAMLHEMRLWPGSYGIRREIAGDHTVFAHRAHYGQQLGG